MQTTGFLFCFRTAHTIEDEERTPCSITAGRYYACDILSDDSTHEIVLYSFYDDKKQRIDTKWESIQKSMERVLYAITEKRSIRSLIASRNGFRGFSRNTMGTPTFVDVMPLEMNKLVSACSFATISKRVERITGFALTLCYEDPKKNFISGTSEIHINVPASTMLRYAEKHSWTLYDEEQSQTEAEALFLCTKAIWDDEGDRQAIFEEGCLYPVTRSGSLNAASYKIKQSPSGAAFHITKDGLNDHFRRIGFLLQRKEKAIDVISGDQIHVQSFIGGKIISSLQSNDLTKDIIASSDKVFIISETECTEGAYLVCYKNSAKSMMEFTFIGDKSETAAHKKASAAIQLLPARTKLFEFDDVIEKQGRETPRRAQKRYSKATAQDKKSFWYN